MSVVYVDSSALLKRVIAEPESSALRLALEQHEAAEDLLASSSLAWIEVWRSLRRAGVDDLATVAAAALSGIAEVPFDRQLTGRAQRVGGDGLRSLDAIHLAAAVALGTDVLITYDDRLAGAARSIGLEVTAPS